MPFYSLEPEVAGELGSETVMDPGQYPPSVQELHYSFSGWPEDDILETFPCFVITRPLADAIRDAKLTGWLLDDLRVTRASQFIELYPDSELPPFAWLKVVGHPGHDDFGIGADHRLVVSQRCLEVLQSFSLANCDVEEWRER